jgi:hypothetical protein
MTTTMNMYVPHAHEAPHARKVPPARETERPSPKARGGCGCAPRTCPSCAGLECFERPRFFCGQLLTDKDLDADQRYVIEKNRLHNRYLFGPGVVCGLAVRCDPCAPCQVIVEPGYALDCCGNDIVVCDPAPFSVCDYLERCREKPECEDKIRSARPQAQGQARDYALVLSYREEPAKPVAALVHDDACRTGRCEPSRTRETFRLDLVERQPPPLPGREADCGELTGLWKRWCECEKEWGRFVTLARKPAGVYEDPSMAYSRLKGQLLELYRRGAYTGCDVAALLDRMDVAFAPPAPAPPETAEVVLDGVPVVAVKTTHAASMTQYSPLVLLYLFYGHFLRECLCDALLVPCPPCEEPAGVRLASLTLRDGRIERICNLERTFVLTGPALRYWFGSLWSGFTRNIEQDCCRDDPYKQAAVLRMSGPTALGAAAAGPAFLSNLMRMRGTLTRRLAELDLPGLFAPGALHAGTVLGRNVNEVRDVLERKGIALTVTEVKAEEASSLENLLGSHFVVPDDAETVEAIADPEGIVTGFRVLKAGKGR